MQLKIFDIFQWVTNVVSQSGKQFCGLEYPDRLLKVKNSTLWNGIQPSEKWPGLAGQKGWAKKKPAE
jgi:hypothetical protein